MDVNRRLRQHPTNGQQNKNATQKFNENVRLIDGYRYANLANGTTTQTISLSAVGKKLLGLSIIPVTGSDITDVALTFNVNGLNLCNVVALDNLNPGFIHNMEYFPLPQPLKGNDSIKAIFNNSSGAAVSLYLNIFYLPR